MTTLHPHSPWTDPVLTDIPGPLPIPSAQHTLAQSRLPPQEREDLGSHFDSASVVLALAGSTEASIKGPFDLPDSGDEHPAKLC